MQWVYRQCSKHSPALTQYEEPHHPSSPRTHAGSATWHGSGQVTIIVRALAGFARPWPCKTYQTCCGPGFQQNPTVGFKNSLCVSSDCHGASNSVRERPQGWARRELISGGPCEGMQAIDQPTRRDTDTDSALPPQNGQRPCVSATATPFANTTPTPTPKPRHHRYQCSLCSPPLHYHQYSRCFSTSPLSSILS